MKSGHGRGWTAAAVVLLAGGVAWAEAPSPGEPSVRRNGYAGVANFVMARPGETIAIKNPPAAGRSRLASLLFLDEYGGAFGITDAPGQLRLLRTEADQLGLVHTVYQQVHKGIVVYSGQVRVHQNAKGEILGANGRFYAVKDTLETTPTLDAAAGEAAARKAVAEGAGAALESIELVVVDPAWYGDPAGTGARLAYHVILNDITRGDLGFREAAFIDAHTGELLDRWSLIETILSRSTHDGQGTTAIPGTLVRTEGSGPSGIADVDKAHDAAADFYNLLQRGFGRDSLNNNGLTLVQTVNTTSMTCPNASWNGVQTRYCAGVAVDDVVGHELAHGLTGYTAGLIYQNQSGQLNESFSDVFGELVDMYNGNVSAIGAPAGTPWPAPTPSGGGLDTPNNPRSVCSPRPVHPDGVRWLVGEESSGFGGAIRDMWDPTCRNHPDRANSPLQTCNPNDAGGVHSGSGVPNHAFALLTDGGTFNGRTIAGIGLIKSGAVWYRALSVYLTPASDFKDAYDAFNQAALDLVGTSPNDPRTGLPSASPFTATDAAQVNEALLAVEMNTDGLCGQTNNVLDDATVPPECAGAVVHFIDDFEGPGLNWQTTNSAPPTPYNWVLTSAALPFGRAGKAAFCEDRAVGNCSSIDESGTHTMTSQTIVLPVTRHPRLAFTHHLGSEGAFDGGRIEIAVNGGAFVPVPRTAMEFNGYNGLLRAVSIGNTNPLAGAEAWSGLGGRWGRTIIDLSALVPTSQAWDCRIRFVFGKDGCTGGPGWYVDDVTIYDCPDCDNDGAADIAEFVHRRSTGFVGPVGVDADPATTLAGVPDAAGNVTLEFLANADLSAGNEYFDITLNGVALGRVFEVGGADCPRTPLRQSLVVPAAAFNAALALGAASAGGRDATIQVFGSDAVNGAICDGSFVGVSVRLARAGAPQDDNTNLVPDACECPRPGCRADFNCSGGQPTVQDIFDFLAAYFSGSPGADFNQSGGGPTVQDIFDFLAAYFGGCA